MSRILLVIVSVVAIGWLGGNELARRESLEGRDALARAKQDKWSPAEAESARAHFARARRFGPDADYLLRQASTLVLLGAPRPAAPLLERVVAAEPRNANAWLFLFAAARDTDPARAAVARRKALELDPSSRRTLDAARDAP